MFQWLLQLLVSNLTAMLRTLPPPTERRTETISDHVTVPRELDPETVVIAMADPAHHPPENLNPPILDRFYNQRPHQNSSFTLVATYENGDVEKIISWSLLISGIFQDGSDENTSYCNHSMKIPLFGYDLKKTPNRDWTESLFLELSPKVSTMCREQIRIQLETPANIPPEDRHFVNPGKDVISHFKVKGIPGVIYDAIVQATGTKTMKAKWMWYSLSTSQHTRESIGRLVKILPNSRKLEKRLPCCYLSDTPHVSSQFAKIWISASWLLRASIYQGHFRKPMLAKILALDRYTIPVFMKEIAEVMGKTIDDVKKFKQLIQAEYLKI